MSEEKAAAERAAREVQMCLDPLLLSVHVWSGIAYCCCRPLSKRPSVRPTRKPNKRRTRKRSRRRTRRLKGLRRHCVFETYGSRACRAAEETARKEKAAADVAADQAKLAAVDRAEATAEGTGTKQQGHAVYSVFHGLTPCRGETSFRSWVYRW